VTTPPPDLELDFIIEPAYVICGGEVMLSNFNMYGVLTADDLERVKGFYTEKLGLKLVEGQMPGLAIFEAGNGTKILFYKKKGAQRPDNTALGFDVQNIEQVVEELKGKGVTFEEYDLPGMKTVNGIADIGQVKSAFFKDSEGNIVALNQM
jgi:predicted enzyme related to lactoylglutathione lyase